MRIAVFADVHGNALALEAVLADIRSMSPDHIFNLGDCVTGPFDPGLAARLQMSLDATTIIGNHDRDVSGDAPSGLNILSRRCLSSGQLAWLASLPATARSGDILACHGSPTGGDTDSLLDMYQGDRTVLADQDTITAKLGETDGISLVLCGHTHNQRGVQLGNILVLNPGSVGLPAFRVAKPKALAVEAGSPHARYAIATRTAGTWSFELRAVVYDWNAAAQQAATHGLSEIADWTRRGRF